MNSSSAQTRLVWTLTAVVVAALWLFSGRIDFHPDEAIYFNGIPVNVRNDTGAFYIAFYSAITALVPGPQGARLASVLLGAGLFAALGLAARRLGNPSNTGTALLFVTFLLSYQGVRPEAAWWFCSALAFYAALCFLQAPQSRIAWLGFLGAAMLLPMNHRLSWFACAFFCGYAILFIWRDLGWTKALSVLGALAMGAVLNIVLRGWWAGTPVTAALDVATASSAGMRQPFPEFARLVFDGAPLFLNDTANNHNLFESLSGLHLRRLSHAFVQNTFWLLMLVLPLIGRSWKERYVLGFPLFAFVAFWLSGYYNPTYSAGFSLFGVLALVFLLPTRMGWQRGVLVAGIVLSVLNGASFIATRVLNHGAATYFEAQGDLQRVVAALPEGSQVAVPERFTPAVGRFPAHTVNFKTDVPAGVDLLVTDSYDRLMYGFVPDFEQKKSGLQRQAEGMCLLKQTTYPVYRNDSLFGNGSTETAGSWFFRNSTSYVLSYYQKCEHEKK